MAYKDILCGIYSITHVKSGRIYIGSAQNIYTRWNRHRYGFKHNASCNPYLKNAWQKYGEDAFQFAVVELVDDKSRLIEREQYWIDYYDSTNRDKGFNIATKAASNLGIKHSPETIAKRVEKLRGQKRSDDFKRQASQWMQGNKNGEGHYWHGRLSESDILPIFQYLADGEKIEDVAARLNVHRVSIGRIITRKTWDHVRVPDNLVCKAQDRYKNRRQESLRANPKVTTLTPAQVAVIKSRLLAGDTCASIARDYGVVDVTIGAIKLGRNWKHIKPNPLP